MHAAKKKTRKKGTIKGVNKTIKHMTNKSAHGKSNSNTADERKRLSAYTRSEIAAKQGWSCKMCAQLLPPAFEIDHAIPLFKGGADEEHNMQALCRNCHGHKSMRERLGHFDGTNNSTGCTRRLYKIFGRSARYLAFNCLFTSIIIVLGVQTRLLAINFPR